MERKEKRHEVINYDPALLQTSTGQSTPPHASESNGNRPLLEDWLLLCEAA